MAASVRFFPLPRFNLNLFRLRPSSPPPLFVRHLLQSNTTDTKKRLHCIISGFDGGGLDEFISTKKTEFNREFSVLANMLKRIEPLDTSVIAKSVSVTAKDSMKRTISTMLGLLPSDQFSVTIRVSKQPLDHLLVSSIITGYTLWNAEYRVSLTKNLDVGMESVKLRNSRNETETSSSTEYKEEIRKMDFSIGDYIEDGDRRFPECTTDLPPSALSYIQELKSELLIVEKELDAQKENMRVESNRNGNNDLLEYLRSLEPDMVTELSRPSSSEVEEIIQQLVQNVLHKFFREDDVSSFMGSTTENVPNPSSDNDVSPYETVGTSRDYLAKLLFWCMLLGHHLRGLEYRLQLSCTVGLL